MEKIWIAISDFLAPKVSYVTNLPPFKWYRNILWAWDFMINAFTFGDPRETTSSVMGKMMRDGTCWFCHLYCGVLSFLYMEKNHCKNAIQEDVGRGTEDDMAPIPGLRRKWSNGFVIIIILITFYQDAIWEFLGKLI